MLGISISLEWAEAISTWANWTLVGALLVGVGATYGIVVSGNVKEAALKKELASAGIEAAKANEKAAAANEATEKLRAKNILLEQAVAPRIVDQGRGASELRPFKGTKVFIQVVADFEARRLAGQLALLLEMAEWQVVKMQPVQDDIIMDGVEISYRSGIKRGALDENNRPIFDFNERGKEAAKSFLSLLSADRIEARDGWTPASPNADQFWPAGTPNEALIIKVGFKPTTYFTKNKIEELKAGGQSVIILDNR